MKSEFPRRRSSPRLSGFDYKGFRAYSITLATANRRQCFVDKAVVSRARGVLEEAAERHGFDLLCYCFMPDHLHALLQGKTEASHLAAFVRAFKQRSGFEFSRDRAQDLWQRSYYDHVVRSHEVVGEVALYILENPVRRRLCDDWWRYHGSGGALKKALAAERHGQT